MWLRKSVGGTTLNHGGKRYHFPDGNPLCEVPAELGHALLRIAGGGYSEAEAPPKPAPKAAAAAKPAAATPAAEVKP